MMHFQLLLWLLSAALFGKFEEAGNDIKTLSLNILKSSGKESPKNKNEIVITIFHGNFKSLSAK
ncbi:hypothetical protein QQP08_004373 [Theobroma cacao]|nr:hypothetical protein QQP08_004373 [Theobroma cacao]